MPFFGDKVKPTKVGQKIADTGDIEVTNGFNFASDDAVAFDNEVTRDGTEFDLSSNVSVNPSNILESVTPASGTPISGSFTVFGGDVTQQTIDLGTLNTQFTSLNGGKLTISITFNANSISGSEPELISLVLTYAPSVVFTFPLSSVDIVGSTTIIDINIPNVDYSAALNTNPTASLVMLVRGFSFRGSYSINALMNSIKGSLHDGIVLLASIEANKVESDLENQINDLRNTIDASGNGVDSIIPRISPYRTNTRSEPETSVAYFAQSTGSDAFPDISAMSHVNPASPTFTVTGTSMFVAVPLGGADSYALITSIGTFLLNTTSQANLSLGRSEFFNNITFAVFRVTGLTANEVVEVDRLTSEQVVAWQDDIDGLKASIERIDAELGHAALDLSDELIDVLDNEVTVSEESNPVINATPYNIGLGTGNNQKVYYETNANTPGSGVLNSTAIDKNFGNDRYRNKLIYLPSNVSYTNQAYLSASDGSTIRDLIIYANGQFSARTFIPAVPAGSTTVTSYPAPSNRVSGAGIWQTIEALTFRNGVPVPEADELFFTRNIPTSSTTLNIQYRGHANGNLFGVGSTTLAGVGGSSEVATTFTISDGGETATMEVRYYPNRQGQRQIRVTVTERVNTGLPTINDVQIILSYTETRSVPGTAATTRDIPLERVSSLEQVFAIKPSSTNTLILVGDIAEIDTGYPYTTLFGATESGHLILGSELGIFLDYEDFNPISTTIVDLQNHATLTQFGLFSTSYTHDTILSFDTRIRARDTSGNLITLGDITGFTIEDTSTNQVYTIGVTNGAFTLTLIP